MRRTTRSTPRPGVRHIAALACAAVALGATAAPAGSAPKAGPTPAPPAYAPGEVVVGYAPSADPAARAAIARAAGGAEAIEGQPQPVAGAEPVPHVVTLPPRTSVPAALAHLRRAHGVEWAVPDYIAHVAILPRAHTTTTLTTAAAPAPASTASPTAAPSAHASTTHAASPTARAAGGPFPDDPGSAHTPGGWRQLQWNFAGTFGVEAPRAWTNLIADHAAGGRRVIVAVLDTGVAYANHGRYRRSPDFYRYQFVRGRDFIAHHSRPYDRNGHGTFVAGTIAEATNNGRALTGLAYGVRIMPVRVLDSEGNGDAATIAKGVRFAVRHGARVINLSLEFPGGITAAEIPELIAALRYAHRHGVVVVAAAGNEAHAAAAYPARAQGVIAVGATTEHGCLASYSNFGAGVALVAPGGGPDANLPGDPNCRPQAPPGRAVFQETFLGASPSRFGLPNGYEGTSMATPNVAAAAALVIASGVLGRHPTPAQVAARLRATARPLGGPTDGRLYGAGLLDAGAATAPGGPGAVR